MLLRWYIERCQADLTVSNPAIKSDQVTLMVSNPAIESDQADLTVLNPAIESDQAALTVLNPVIESDQVALTAFNPAIESVQTALTTFHDPKCRFAEHSFPIFNFSFSTFFCRHSIASKIINNSDRSTISYLAPICFIAYSIDTTLQKSCNNSTILCFSQNYLCFPFIVVYLLRYIN